MAGFEDNVPLVLLGRSQEIHELLLGGRYDYIFPVETRQKPLMDLLATPDEDKHHVIFEAGHLPLPRADMIRETLEWLDRYQNPVVPLTRPSSSQEQ